MGIPLTIHDRLIFFYIKIGIPIPVQDHLIFIVEIPVSVWHAHIDKSPLIWITVLMWDSTTRQHRYVTQSGWQKLILDYVYQIIGYQTDYRGTSRNLRSKSGLSYNSYCTPIILLLHDDATRWKKASNMMTSSNGNTFRVTGHLCGEFTGHRWIPRTKASDAELWCFLWSAPDWTAE